MVSKTQMAAIRSLWPDHCLTEVAEKTNLAKSTVWRLANAMKLPAKPKNFRRTSAKKMEKARKVLVMRNAGGHTWQNIADAFHLPSRGVAYTLAEYARSKAKENEI
jgi:hypothetical protein